MNPEHLTAISLAVVFFNALSGVPAYAIMRRIDYKSGLMLAGRRGSRRGHRRLNHGPGAPASLQRHL